MQNYRYDGSTSFKIKNFDCSETGEFKERHEAIREFTENLEKINEYQQKLFAEQKEGLIFVFQAMDAAGKDGAVRAVLSCLSPQGVSEHSFKVPSAEENRHDYLWRFWDAIPEKGSISIFNRSYYEDVLVQRVHKYYLKNRYANRIDKENILEQRYGQIRNFEKYLWENSIRVVKIFLNVSKNEQANRFLARIDTPKKNWKFSSSDIDERAYWDEYMKAYEICINRTARKNTPWYVVPADHKWYARLVISRIVLNELRIMNPEWPVLDEDGMQRLESYRERLMQEADIEIREEEEESGEKIRPSDIAVKIALNSDRKALSEKKFRKQLQKSVFENFSERFGVSEQTQEELGKIYLDFEEREARATADDIEALESLYRSNKKTLKGELEGHGKEARKVYDRFKDDAKAQIKNFSDSVNVSYVRYEEDLKKFMSEYEIAVSAENAEPVKALSEYETSVQNSYSMHRAEVGMYKSEALEKITDIFKNYSEIGKAFVSAEEEQTDTEAETAPETLEAPDAEEIEVVAACAMTEDEDE